MDDDRRVCPPAIRIAADIGAAARGDVSTAASIVQGSRGGVMLLEDVGAASTRYRVADLTRDFDAAYPGVLDGAA